ncbi:VanZ family protein [Heyndrickxia ginsengihumi]|uniref:VanZ family protein n=1 Tax=Heyndrickxia ginsengihumi TaxID=363870 RepID=UPI002041CBB9|nr:VanZ family protein [Heyndrickxia ginsengihumi]MCM3023160.1 VanZ family protein [Heyndrickxia ginsengihumi]
MKTIYVYALLIASILFIIDLTMLPHSQLSIGVNKGFLNLNPLLMFQQQESFYSFIINVGGNIFLFVPFSFFLSMIMKNVRMSKVVLIGCCFSVAIECIQLFMPNRCTDIDDVLLNTMGAYVGYLLYLYWVRMNLK